MSFRYETNTYDFFFHRYFLISWNIDICCEAECKRLVLEHGNRIFISCNAKQLRYLYFPEGISWSSQGRIKNKQTDQRNWKLLAHLQKHLHFDR